MPGEVHVDRLPISNQGTRAEELISEVCGRSRSRWSQARETSRPHRLQEDAPQLTNSTKDAPQLTNSTKDAPQLTNPTQSLMDELCHSQSELLSLCRQADAKLEQLLLVRLHQVQSQQKSRSTSPRLAHDDPAPFEPVRSSSGGRPCSDECVVTSPCCDAASPFLVAQWIAPAEPAAPERAPGIGGPLGVGGKSCQCDWGAPSPPTMEPAPLTPAPLLANETPRESTLRDDRSDKSAANETPLSSTLSDDESEKSGVTVFSNSSDALEHEFAKSKRLRMGELSRKSHIDAIQALHRVSAPTKNVLGDGRMDSVIGRLVTDHRFNILITGVVALNALLVGLQVQNQAVSSGETHRGLEVAEYVFTAIFTVELVLRAFGLRCAMFWKEHRLWTAMDSTLVLMGVVDVAVEIIGIQTMQSNEDDTDIARQSTSIGKSIKVLRMARFLRLMRLVRFLTSVRIMVTMIVGSLTALFWLFVLLTIVMYIFGVVLTHGATDWRASNQSLEEDLLRRQVLRFFGSMDKTMYTLFICITGGLSWSEASDVVIHFGAFYFAVFMFFMFFIFFSVLNIVTGVFVDAAIQQADSDRSLRILQQEIAKKAVLEDLRELLCRLDENGDGLISAEEWMLRIDDPPVKSLFSRLSIPCTDYVGLFDTFDVDGDGNVSIAELVGGVEKMGGTAQALQMVSMHKLGERILDTVKVVSYDCSKTAKEVERLLELHEGHPLVVRH